MKIKYYGTSAGGGIPEIFCSCRICNDARERRGRNIRTRSQAVIDDRLAIDYPVDTFLHNVYGGLDMRKIDHVLITHAHHDHFLAQDIISRPQGKDTPVRFYISEKSGKALKASIEASEESYRSGKRIRTSNFRAEVETLYMYEKIKILDYEVIPLRANHALNMEAMNFIIKSADKAVLWGHDTGKFLPEVIDYLKNSGIVFDLISLDCTLKRGEQITKAHMDLDWCIETVDMLREQGNVDDDTKVILSHIGHLAERTHDELEAEASGFGMLAAYDGMEIEI